MELMFRIVTANGSISSLPKELNIFSFERFVMTDNNTIYASQGEYKSHPLDDANTKYGIEIFRFEKEGHDNTIMLSGVHGFSDNASITVPEAEAVKMAQAILKAAGKI